jgi:hypothetical protein
MTPCATDCPQLAKAHVRRKRGSRVLTQTGHNAPQNSRLPHSTSGASSKDRSRPIKDPPGRQDHGAAPAGRVQFCSRGGASLQMKWMSVEFSLISDTPVRLTMSDAYTSRLAVEL